MKNTLFATLFLCFACFYGNAQTLHEAPSLQVGLSGLSFTKGTLDAELIAEIIAEKQKEVKTKLVKNMLLKSIGVENGLFYTYIDNTINIITTEKDEKVRAKNLLENTVNLSFVIAYTDYYLRTMQPRSKALKQIRNLAVVYNVDTSLIQTGNGLEAISQIKHTSQTTAGFDVADDDTAKANANQFIGVLLDIFAEVVRKNENLKELGLMRTNYLQNAGSTNAYLNLEDSTILQRYGVYVKNLKAYHSQKRKSGKEKAAFTAYDTSAYIKQLKQEYLLDSMLTGKGDCRGMVAKVNEVIEALRLNKAPDEKLVNDPLLAAYLKKLQFEYDTLKQLIRKNKGNQNDLFLTNRNYKTVRFNTNARYGLIEQVIGINPDPIKKMNNPLMNKALESIVMGYVNVTYNFNLLQQLNTPRSLADAVFENATDHLNLYINYFGLIKTLATKGKDTAAVFAAMENTFPNCGNPSKLFNTISLTYDSAIIALRKVTYTGKQELDELAQVNRFLGKVKFVTLNRYEYMAEYETEIKPCLDRLGAYSKQFGTLRDSLFSYLSCIDQTAKTDMHKMGLNFNTGFIAVFTRLDEFDKVNTYDLYLNLLSDAGDVFSNDKMRSSINRILTFVRSYVKIERDDGNQISMRLDAEGFIYAIQKMNYNKFRPVEFLFTVGTNNAAFHWNALYLTPDDSIKNYSYASEKIGIKYKLWDYAYTRSFNRGETFEYRYPFCRRKTYIRNAPASEPVVSNIHMLAYASGILYNIANTGTTKDFNRPMLGVGLGITFFNGLDMNFCVGRPLQKDRGFFTGGNPTFLNVGFDIQFVEYIDRLNKKRQDNQTQKRISDAVTSQNKN